MRFRIVFYSLLLVHVSLTVTLAQEKESTPKAEDQRKNGTDANAESNEKAPVEAGKSVSRTYFFEEADKEMSYQVFLPKKYYDELKADKKKKFPLIVALHGYGSNPKQIVGYPGFTRRANKKGYVIVAPMGYNKRGWYGSHGKRGGRGDDPKNLGELSEKDVLNVLDIAMKEFKVDPLRIYLYGHSMGGGGSLHLAIKYPDKWAAVAPMAPAIPWGLRNLKQAAKVPFFVVHGDNDRVLPVKSTRKMIEQMKELKITHVYKEVEDGNHLFVAWKYFDEIFEFFDKHSLKKKAAAK